jgi:hypothetical protein
LSSYLYQIVRDVCCILLCVCVACVKSGANSNSGCVRVVCVHVCFLEREKARFIFVDFVKCFNHCVFVCVSVCTHEQVRGSMRVNM